MTRDENIEAIRKACIKANPQIVELQFGCRILQAGTGRSFTVLGTTPKGDPITMDTPGIYDASKPSGASVEVIEGKKAIIGRPIRFADVLMVLSKVKKPNALVVGCSGGFYWWDRADLRDNRVSWKTENDDLTQQSGQTLAFIASLL